jgi:hypothetical protein
VLTTIVNLDSVTKIEEYDQVIGLPTKFKYPGKDHKMCDEEYLDKELIVPRHKGIH